MPQVPSTRDVTPGAFVNIILKADQPTGRTVQGTVSQLLTRGNHPRGIKVRLSDGRVGRVQSLAEGVSQQGDTKNTDAEDTTRATSRSAAAPQYVDARYDQEQPSSSQPIGLEAYIKPAKKRGKGKNKPSEAAEATTVSFSSPPQIPDLSEEQSLEKTDATCPVCGDFRGDEAALTHHVQSHFDD
ncbi:hypothetical protein B0J18DRAFT_299945 [Chaetomium sp. MPI-SDFR-AT-0129]|nr:hypothetical protein B0J18DRAFT_299945 [Chaetomium sp. MPI-SDFR-AT-0129]